jgi:hypothetical protein
VGFVGAQLSLGHTDSLFWLWYLLGVIGAAYLGRAVAPASEGTEHKTVTGAAPIVHKHDHVFHTARHVGTFDLGHRLVVDEAALSNAMVESFSNALQERAPIQAPSVLRENASSDPPGLDEPGASDQGDIEPPGVAPPLRLPPQSSTTKTEPRKTQPMVELAVAALTSLGYGRKRAQAAVAAAIAAGASTASDTDLVIAALQQVQVLKS